MGILIGALGSGYLLRLCGWLAWLLLLVVLVGVVLIAAGVERKGSA